MRRAVEQHLNPAPLVSDDHSDDHPFNRGMIFATVGNLVVYMMTESPGEFFLDLLCKRPATDDMAKAAFGLAEFARYRHQAREVAGDRRIEQAVAAAASTPTEADKVEERREELRQKAARAVRQVAKRVQAEADKAATRWLDAETPTQA